jgi:hypothetical protein
MYCGQKIRESTDPVPGGMLTASHVPFTDNPEEDAAEPPPSEVGGYRLLRFLGSGGMGAVYEAESAGGQHVAVKLLSSRLAASPASVERFRQEGRLASQLSHPRCVFVLAADTEAGRPYIVMELMPGRTLKDLVDKTGPLPPHDAIAHILDAIDGLAEAHRLGVLHRDIKPSNCFLTADDRVKVGDFGLAKSLAAEDDRHITHTGAFLGTVLFASPEQIRGEPLDYGSDVYAICATLYYLLQGEAPYQHESVTAALAKAISEPPPSICARQSQVSRALERVVLRGLERDRDRRWQSLDELREALVDLLPSRQVPARPRAIAGAFLLDCLIIILAIIIPLELLHSILNWKHVIVAGRFVDPVGWALAIAYFATFEGLLGRAPGKWLLGLRVSRVGQTGPPGLERGWIRTVSFALVLFWTIYAAPILDEMLGGIPAIAAFLLGVFVISTQLRRTPDGYRGFHDFVSGCHITQRPLPVRRLRLVSRFASPLDALLPTNEAEPLPASLGGYSVIGRLWVDPRGEQVWSAEDRLLGRRVLIWLMPNDGNPATPIGNDVPRLTRLRRLGRGSFRWAGRDLEWVAFAAPVGAPLADTVRRPLSWADARLILGQLVEELQAGCADGSTPERLSLGQVWVEPSGRVKLLDFPMAIAPQAASHRESPDALIRQAATLMLEGAPRTESWVDWKGAAIRAPVPPHAAPILARMFLPGGYASLEELQAALQATHAHPPEVTPAIRAAHLGIQAALLGFGLMFMFGLSGIVAVLFLLTSEQWVQVADATLADLRNPEKHEQIRLMQGAAEAIDNPRAIGRIEAMRSRQRDEAADRRHSLLAVQKFLLRSSDRVDDSKAIDPNAMLALERELMVWSAAHEKSLDGRGGSPWRFWAEPIWLMLLAIPIGWVLAAAVFRGGLSMMIAGIAVVRADGRRATRRQCAVRAAAVWLPITALLAAAMWLQIYHWRQAILYAGLWLTALGLLPLYVAVALRSPSRPPQDRIAGTYLVPE